MSAGNRFSDDVKLLDYLLRTGIANTAWWVAHETGVDPEYAEQALAEMADATDDPPYPVVRRRDLGPDVYEAVEL